ncbi:hypothetical protein [Flavisolibacter ginsenosidimutans]|uniref:TonB-dependent receptor plug domain-containing protein n=1 Tax=Flavisolibacter ginsenosidimutans TaxID=661481 RepID=A0A5B8UK76_9BACT|nr:hypothetical protein [Flavisolibacter ginsenosidimutans]QEC56420.1 hypothetical protein FSB75_11125 [Flavisolibacter ginsenosidimutans]
MKRTLFFLSACLLLAVALTAQPTKGRLDIQLNKAILQPGDSLRITADYKDGQAATPSLATLEIIIEAEQGQRTRLRWPVINGHVGGTLYLPDSLPRGKYTLLAGVQSRFFEVVGKIQDARKPDAVQAMLLTKSGDWDEQEIPVAADGSFVVRNWLFEDNALMAFSDAKASGQPLNIRISTQLDSSFNAVAVAGRAFYVGNPSAAVRRTLNQPVEGTAAAFADGGSLLPAVLVKTTAKSPAQQYNEEHSSGLFRSGDERLISLLDDPGANSFPNVFSYLQGRVAGLEIEPFGLSGGAARWRGSPVTFFLDEVRVPAGQVAAIPMTDIAIIKAYPPPFLGAPGSGGAIAVYTRRGGEATNLPAGKQVFKVRGYTPSATVLNLNRLSI